MPKQLLNAFAAYFSANASRKQLIVISDMQKGDWQSVDFSSLVGDLEVEFYQVGVPDDPEGRGDNRSLVETKVVPAGPVKFEFGLSLETGRVVEEEQLELVVGGEVRSKSDSSFTTIWIISSAIYSSDFRNFSSDYSFSEPDSLPP